MINFRLARTIILWFLNLYLFGLLSSAGLANHFWRNCILRYLFIWLRFSIQRINFTFVLFSLLLFPIFFLIFRYFLRWLRLLFLFFTGLRLSFIDIIFNLLKCAWICLNAMFVIIQIILLGLTFPRIFTNHIHIRFRGFIKLLIFLKRVFFKSINAPWKQFEHVWVLPTIFGCLAKYLFWKIDLIRLFWFDFFLRDTVHLEII